MIVDVHTRVWQSAEQLGAVMLEVSRRRPEPWDRPDASLQSHRKAMDAVDAAIVHGLRIDRLKAHVPDHVVADYVKDHGERLLGFAGIDPAAGKAQRQLRTALDLGLVGATINPAAQGYHPCDTKAMELYEMCAAKGVPIFIDTRGGMTPQAKLEFAQPVLFDEVLRQFDKLTLVFASCAYPFVSQCLTLMMKHERVYANLADQLARPWGLYDALVRAYQLHATDRLLLGSGFPFNTPHQAMVTLYSAASLARGTQLPTVPRQQIRSIIERDALTCLNLAESLKVARTDRSRTRNGSEAYMTEGEPSA